MWGRIWLVWTLQNKDEIEILFPRRDCGCSVKTNVMDDFLSDGTIDFFKDIGIEKCEDYDEWVS